MIINFKSLSIKNLEPVEPQKQNHQNAPVSEPINPVVTTKSAGLLDKNYNSLLLQKNNPNFGSKIPLSTKISSVLQIVGDDDLILVGNNQKEAMNLLRESMASVTKVIKRLFMIEDKNIKGTFAITQKEGVSEVVNLDKKPLVLSLNGDEMAFEKGETSVMFENDKIFLDKMEISLVNDYQSDLSKVRELSVKRFDFSQQDLPIIQNLNIKHLEQAIDQQIKEPISDKKFTFADVGGQDEAIAELKKSIIYPIKYPEAFKNQILNRGTILVGDPGNGKTLLAKAVANEVDANFIELNGLELETKWIGETEEKWRNLFSEAKEHQPSIIFIDEIDAVGQNRDDSTSARFANKVVNQLLTLMSDLEKGKFGNVFVIAASNKLNIVDPALIRSGRFGKHLDVKNPDLKGCKHIFEIHSKDKPLSENLDTEGFVQKLHNQKTSGADIAKIVNDAHTNSYLRLGIFDKMESGSFVQSDIESLRIQPEDFKKALSDFQKQDNAKPYRTIVTGYKSYTEKS